ncbi:unnamed protein product [Ixodes persulcatus]
MQRSAPYEMLCRVYGCVFINSFRGKSLRNAKVNWKSLYTIYASSCFVSNLFFETPFVTYFANLLMDMSDGFSRFLLLTIRGIVTVEVIANSVAMLAKPQKLLDFLQRSEGFERNTGLFPLARSLRNSAPRFGRQCLSLQCFEGCSCSTSREYTS